MITGHQGDVQFRQLETLPEGFIKTENKPLAIGNSGHCHVVTGDAQRYESGDRVIFVLNQASRLQHTDLSLMNEKAYSSPDLLLVKDHNPHLLPSGIYEFFIQNAFNPYTRLMEQVKD